MRKKIYRRLMGTATLAILSTVLLTVAVCYNLLKNQVMEDLQIYTRTVSHMLENGIQTGNVESAGKELLLNWEEELKRDKIRITLVGKDGSVLYDTLAAESEMENHKERPEISQAFTSGEGKEIRRSATLDKNTYYYAIRLSDGSVLRAAKDADSIYMLFEFAVPYLLGIAVVLLIVCGIMSHFMAGKIIRPIKLIAEDVENVEKIETYEEMKPFIDAIRNQHKDVLQNARIRQEFTANVSHELKTPLTAISGYAELIENGMVAQPSEINRFTGEIHSNANRLLTLINDVIRLSELDSEETEEILTPVNLWECANTCVNMMQIYAEKSHVTLQAEGENVMIMASRQMVDEVLYNLCSNAIRYNKENGKVNVIIKDRLNTAQLIVRDTGIGIPKEHQERIFERFYRVDKSRSKSTGGTGLGLAIVKHILIKLDAEISLKSEEGRGTEITVTFPTVRAQSLNRI